MHSNPLIFKYPSALHNIDDTLNLFHVDKYFVSYASLISIETSSIEFNTDI